MRLTLSSDLHGDTGSAMFCANGKQEFLMLSFVRIGHWPCTQKKNYRTSSIQDGCEELQMVCPQNTKTLRHRISFILYVLLLISLWCAFFSLQGKPARGRYPHMLFCRKKLYLRRLHWTHVYLGTGVKRRITPAKQATDKCIQRTFLARDLK